MKTGPDEIEEERRKIRKRDPMPSEPPEMSLRAQNMKQDPTPSAPPKTCSGAHNMKTRRDALGTAEN
jgi:hypothetical protein